MPLDREPAPPSAADEGDMAKALQELAKGERTAAALENQLSAMEAKIEALLAKAQAEQEEIKSGGVTNSAAEKTETNGDNKNTSS